MAAALVLRRKATGIMSSVNLQFRTFSLQRRRVTRSIALKHRAPSSSNLPANSSQHPNVSSDLPKPNDCTERLKIVLFISVREAFEAVSLKFKPPSEQFSASRCLF
ncbi:hypothetical protein NQZ68_023698 [Dissostichus eleginoides]|nr:hypothetical protein NQZ68_023698 [Dissostichus eleginoides]